MRKIDIEKIRDPDYNCNENYDYVSKKFVKWTLEENYLYAAFLEENMDEFMTLKKRRSPKFFKKMSEHLGGGRTNGQCRSHHQKMIIRYDSIERIIKKFKERESSFSGAE